jgi:hypothetical protein
MNDSAKGSISGFIFQFQRALLLLCDITEKDNYITIEEVDDVAVHSDRSVLISEQDKHSFLEKKSAYEDTSIDLWRTLEIWVLKLKNNTFNNETKFNCTTNNSIRKNGSLIEILSNKNYEVSKKKINEILLNQKKKLSSYKNKGSKKGTHIEKVITKISFCLENENEFKQVLSNIEVNECIEIKDIVISKLNITSFDKIQQDKIFDDLIGWLVSSSYSKWKNNNEAEFKKTELDKRFKLCIQSPDIVNAIFRAKKEIQFDNTEIDNKKDELFVKQIDVLKIRRESKEHFINTAIEDFIKYEIELLYVIDKGNFTEEDFLEFMDKCKNDWEFTFSSKLMKEIEDYSEDELNVIAIEVYKEVMQNYDTTFKLGYAFNSENKYIKNGSLLRLSNIPEIGWHPKWKEYFLNND